MMILRWTGANGTVLDIQEPESGRPMPGYVYQTSSGFGGSGSELWTVSGPYQNGATFLGALLVPRSVNLVFTIIAASTESLFEKRREVAGAFSPYGGEGVLSWIQGDRTFHLRCIAEGPSPNFLSGKASGPTWQAVSVTLKASDPCWYETTEGLYLQGVTGGLTFPCSFPVSFATVSPSVTILNPGDVPSPVIMRITGPVTDPVITNETTGETLSLDIEVAAEDYIDIGTEFAKTYVRDSDGDSIMGTVIPGSIFWQVEPGENTLSYSDSGGSAQILIQYSPRYTGV